MIFDDDRERERKRVGAYRRNILLDEGIYRKKRLTNAYIDGVIYDIWGKKG